MSKSAKKNGKQAQSDVLYDIAIEAVAGWSALRVEAALYAFRMQSKAAGKTFENVIWAASFEKPALMLPLPARA